MKSLYAATLSLLVTLMPFCAQAASVVLDPQTSTHGRGETFLLAVRLDTGGECINALDVTLTYPTNLLRAVDFSRGESILSLWAVEPRIDTDKGTITFAGGIPGGYCGRIIGDAGQSDILGTVVFTAIGTDEGKATVLVAPSTVAYLNDGQGTRASLTLGHSTISLLPSMSTSSNPWLDQVRADSTPPQPFSVDVESTAGVFGGKYYIIFSTTDKESGLDHYEIADRGGWKRITSPYLLPNQSFFGVGDVEVRAVDKAGNMRLGLFSATSTPQRQFTAYDIAPFVIALIALVLAFVTRYLNHRKSEPTS